MRARVTASRPARSLISWSASGRSAAEVQAGDLDPGSTRSRCEALTDRDQDEGEDG
jgi:hypothetical protein